MSKTKKKPIFTDLFSEMGLEPLVLKKQQHQKFKSKIVTFDLEIVDLE